MMILKLKPLVMLFLVTTLITGCGGNRQVQCRKLIEVVNLGHLAIAIHPNQNNSATPLRIAQELNMIADQMEELRLRNGRLQTIRLEFTDVFRELATVFQKMNQALEAGEKAPISLEGRAELVQAIERVNQVSQQINPIREKADTLTAEMTQYCPPESLSPEEPATSQ